MSAIKLHESSGISHYKKHVFNQKTQRRFRVSTNLTYYPQTSGNGKSHVVMSLHFYYCPLFVSDLNAI